MTEITNIRNLDPHSVTLKRYNTQGRDFLICIRTHSIETLFQAIEEAEKRSDALGLMGWGEYCVSIGKDPSFFKDNYDPTRGVPDVSHDTNPEAKSSNQPMTTGGSRQPFRASRMKAQWSDTRSAWNWRVFGDNMPSQFSQFGLPIWDEGLEASGFPPDLEGPTPKAPDIRGYLVEWTEFTDKGGKQRAKVIAMSKPASIAIPSPEVHDKEEDIPF